MTIGPIVETVKSAGVRYRCHLPFLAAERRKSLAPFGAVSLAAVVLPQNSGKGTLCTVCVRSQCIADEFGLAAPKESAICRRASTISESR
jgi:hypothetical protein